MFNYEKFAEMLRANRKNREFTIEELAELINEEISANALGQYERNVSKPSTKTIIDILNTFNTNLDAFFEGNLPSKDDVYEQNIRENLNKLNDKQVGYIYLMLSILYTDRKI